MLFFLVALLFRVVHWLIGAYMTVLVCRMILDWVAVLAPRWYPRGVVATLVHAVYQLTDPPLRWLRRYIPPIPMGPIMFDTSFLVLYFVLVVAQVII